MKGEVRESIIHKYRFQWVGLIISMCVALAGAILRAQTQIETGLVMFIGGSLVTVTIFLSTLIIKGREDIDEAFRKTIGLTENEFRQNIEEIKSNFLKMNEVSQKIAADPVLRDFYYETINPLRAAFETKDEVFREEASNVLREFYMRLENELSRGTITFRAELFWPIYQKLLNQDDVKSYKSIAWVRSEDYWTNAAGRAIVDFNYELVTKGKSIERIFILPDKVWTNKRVKRWIREQKNRGINVKIVKENSILPEEELRCDLGIYGERAVGYVQEDENCRILQFDLHFDKKEIDKANGIFEQLKTHALRAVELEKYFGSIMSSEE